MDLTFSEPRTDTESEALVEQMLVEMERLNQKMRDDQAEIDRLKAESKRIRAESDIIRGRTTTRLNELEAMLKTHQDKSKCRYRN